MKTFRTALAVLLLASSNVLASRAAALPAYKAAWRQYQAAVANGASVDERLALLDGLLRRFRNRNVDVLLSRAKAERSFLYSLSFYLKTVRQGASPNERKYLLKRIRVKFKNSGVDLSLVEKEYASLPAPVPPSPAPAAVTVDSMTAVAADAPTATVTLSTAPAQETTPPATAVYRPPHPRHALVGFDAVGLGRHGLYGGDLIVNCSDRLSFAAGYGQNTPSATLPNAASRIRQTSCSLLARYGRNVYLSTGIQMRTVSGEITAGETRAAGQTTGYGIPIVLGVQSGGKRGLFFMLELSYVPYLFETAKTLRAADISSGETASLKLSSSDTPVSFGIGLGCYFF